MSTPSLSLTLSFHVSFSYRLFNFQFKFIELSIFFFTFFLSIGLLLFSSIILAFFRFISATIVECFLFLLLFWMVYGFFLCFCLWVNVEIFWLKIFNLFLLNLFGFFFSFYSLVFYDFKSKKNDHKMSFKNDCVLKMWKIKEKN